jgi:hypothetical protein
MMPFDSGPVVNFSLYRKAEFADRPATIDSGKKYEK